MRVVFPKNFSDKARALLVGRRWAHALIVHGVKNAALHGFQTVAHVRQRP